MKWIAAVAIGVLAALSLVSCAGDSGTAASGASEQANSSAPDGMRIAADPFLSLIDIPRDENGLFSVVPQMMHAPVCGFAEPGSARCHARVIVDEDGQAATAASPTGYGPSQFLSAYNLPGTTTGNPIIGIVDAYDDPNIYSDLTAYSQYYGLPVLPTCPASPWPPAAPCFRKVSQTGGTSYPSSNSGWSLEIALDVEVAHAICQNCTILLVEAKNSLTTNLMAAEDRARILGAKVVSNSWGGGESLFESASDGHFNYSGIAFTVSSGDNGYGVEYPAASQYVTAVGGTSLTGIGGTVVETVWSGAGSGCSRYETRPSFQTALGLTGCSKRMVADVSADADPNTGAAVYDTVAYNGQTGWFQVGGTSLASPLVGAVYALGGSLSGLKANSLPYSRRVYGTNLRDVVSGNNGSCSPSYLCTGTTGYDGPTGLGTPITAAAF